MTPSGASMIVFYISFTIVAFHLLPCMSFFCFHSEHNYTMLASQSQDLKCVPWI
jgi:hypothetical protein